MADDLCRFTRREFVIAGAMGACALGVSAAHAGSTATVLPPQVFFAQLRRVMIAMRRAGAPLDHDDEQRLLALSQHPSGAAALEADTLLQRYTLLMTRLGQDGLGTTVVGGATTLLVEQGWRAFLVRIENPYGVRAALMLDGDAVYDDLVLPERSSTAELATLEDYDDYGDPWLGYRIGAPTFPGEISGMPLEYHVVQLFSRDRGSRRAYLMLHGAHAARGLDNPVSMNWRTFALGGRGGVWIDFSCLPTRDRRLAILDADGRGCTASLLVEDEVGRIYPPQARRLAPDFDFQRSVYRADGETLRLPDGRYTITAWRGPEYRPQVQHLQIGPESGVLECRLVRWIDAASLGWYPGDPHVHAAGCAHYELPTQGVAPESMLRHVRGEALAVGDILTWGPGFDYQKQFFTGHVYVSTHALELPALQRRRNVSLVPAEAAHDVESLIRYDIEVAGFPSSHSGHLLLLGLREQDYPGARSLRDWPSWNLPILRWARDQGCVTGYGHCGSGLSVDSTSLPNDELPRFDVVGANEFIVDVTHGLVDFLAGCEFSPIAELNVWYHVLNCGFRVAMAGETDFPCITDQRVGLGRTYVGLGQPPDGDGGYQAWIAGLGQGRSYFGDGRSHFIDFEVNGHPVGSGIVAVPRPVLLRITARFAAWLDVQPSDAADLPPWHLEHARLDRTREVAIELVVNGTVRQRRAVTADGTMRPVEFMQTVEDSAWIALRVLPSGHTNPVYVEAAGRPIRASRSSADWCLRCIDVLWDSKSHRIRTSERQEAAAAYQHARDTYLQLGRECAAEDH